MEDTKLIELKTAPKGFRADKLKILAEHLLHGKLGHKVFDFSQTNCNVINNHIETIITNICDTKGCAMGELPIVFPDEWEFSSYDGKPKPLMGNSGNPLKIDVKGYFNLNLDNIIYLFYPTQIFDIGGRNKFLLPTDATKKDVANRILDFIEFNTQNK